MITGSGAQGGRLGAAARENRPPGDGCLRRHLLVPSLHILLGEDSGGCTETEIMCCPGPSGKLLVLPSRQFGSGMEWEVVDGLSP